MGHELITAPGLAALESALFKAVQAEQAGDPLRPVAVLVGSHYLGRYLTRRLARLGPGLLNLRLITLRQMALQLGREPLETGTDRVRLPRGIAPALIEHTIDQAGLELMQPVQAFPGFRSALLATFRDLRDAGLADELARGLESAAAGRLSPKIREAGRAARFFWGSYRELYYDDAELFGAAAGNARHFLERFGTGRLLIYGLYDFTRVQARLIQGLAAAAPLTVFLPWAPGPAYEYARTGRQFFLSLPGVQETALDYASASGGDLAKVQATMAGAAANTGKSSPAKTGPGKVEIVSAAGELREVQEIAGRVLKLAEQGTPFGRMGILVRNTELYLPLVREVMAGAGIPCFFTGIEPVGQSPEERCLHRLLSLLDRGDGPRFPRAEIMEFLSGPGARLPGSDPFLPSRWREYSIAAGVVAGPEDWDQKLAALAADRKTKPDRQKEIEAFRQRVLDLISCLLAFPEPGRFNDFGVAFNGLLKNFTEYGLTDEIFLDLKGLDRLGVAANLDRFRKVVVSRPLLEEDEEELEEREAEPDMATTSEEPARRFQEGAVTVGSIMGLRGLRFSAVFVPGLSSRSFPAPPREDPILLDREREELQKVLGLPGALPKKGLRPWEDRLLFGLTVEAAEESLTLTYSRTDEQGGHERLGSRFLLEAAGAMAGGPVDYSRLSAGQVSGVTRTPISRVRLAGKDPQVLVGRPALHEEEFLLWAVAQGSLPRDSLPPTALKIHPFLAAGWKLLEARKKIAASPVLGFLGSEPARTELAKWTREKYFSAGELETYARCPFQYFCGRVMRLKPVDLPESAEFEASSRGRLVHEVLKKFMEQQRENRGRPLRDQGPKQLLVELEKIFDEVCAEETERPGSDLEWELIQNDLRAGLPEILEALLNLEDGDFLPAEFERSFGSESERVNLQLPAGEIIRLKGRIDRIDRSAAAAAKLRVIDYKTGRNPFGKNQVLRSGTALQAPLYLLAAAEITGQAIDDLAESESGYVYVMGQDAGKIKLQPGTREILDRARQALEVILSGVRSGVFCPTPAQVEKDICNRRCDYRGLCGTLGSYFQEFLTAADPAKKIRGQLDEFE